MFGRRTHFQILWEWLEVQQMFKFWIPMARTTVKPYNKSKTLATLPHKTQTMKFLHTIHVQTIHNVNPARSRNQNRVKVVNRLHSLVNNQSANSCQMTKIKTKHQIKANLKTWIGLHLHQRKNSMLKIKNRVIIPMTTTTTTTKVIHYCNRETFQYLDKQHAIPLRTIT